MELKSRLIMKYFDHECGPLGRWLAKLLMAHDAKASLEMESLCQSRIGSKDSWNETPQVNLIARIDAAIDRECRIREAFSSMRVSTQPNLIPQRSYAWAFGGGFAAVAAVAATVMLLPSFRSAMGPAADQNLNLQGSRALVASLIEATPRGVSLGEEALLAVSEAMSDAMSEPFRHPVDSEDQAPGEIQDLDGLARVAAHSDDTALTWSLNNEVDKNQLYSSTYSSTKRNSFPQVMASRSIPQAISVSSVGNGGK